jgi:imidazole glycerol-phosphate synthase subunit HisH
MIVIIDYGMGNVGSVLNMLKKIGAAARISADRKTIAEADKLILPGVGAFDRGMTLLRELDLIDLLNEKVLDRKTPVLGVCLGMQLLSRRSEEGELPGLGWIEADTVRFRFAPGDRSCKVPHMGWNTVQPTRCDALFGHFQEAPRFYFVHYYHVVCDDDGDVLARCTHGFPFAAAVQRGNVYGTQFHPEKSHKFGLQLLTRFAEAA